jgi:hypothetical protein
LSRATLASRWPYWSKMHRMSPIDVDVTPRLIKLTDVDDAHLQSRDVVHPSESAVLAALAGEDDRAPTFNLGDGAIAELDGAIDLSVKLSEELLGPDHMVCCTGVEDPFSMVVLLHRTQVHKDLLLGDMDGVARWWS